MEHQKTSERWKALYETYYDDNLELWRELGAKQKADNAMQVVGKQRFNRVLEVGAGTGALTAALVARGLGREYSVAEISTSALEQIAKKQIAGLREAVLYDGYVLPWTDGHFDAVVLSHVLEHVEYPRMLLREIKRVAQNLIIEVPRDYKSGVDLRVGELMDYGHINVYTPSLLRFLLRTEGFVVVRDKTSFTSKDLLMYMATKQRKRFAGLRANLQLGVQNLVCAVLPDWRRETMINAYTAWCRAE
jgi:SAM-dependent methyltransferase